MSCLSGELLMWLYTPHGGETSDNIVVLHSTMSDLGATRAAGAHQSRSFGGVSGSENAFSSLLLVPCAPVETLLGGEANIGSACRQLRSLAELLPPAGDSPGRKLRW